MATTTNFGWTTPDDTALVKDGAAAIRTLGSSIDTSLVDLKGGTSGQVLSKNSNSDLDFTWVAQDDSNAIQNAIVDAKGDLIGATAADTPARLAVGTNGQVLTADSAEATGLKWATPSAGGGMTSIASGTLSGTSVVLSSISGSYKNLYLIITSPTVNTATPIGLRLNGNASSNYASKYGALNSTSWLLQPDYSQLYIDGANINIPTTANDWVYTLEINDYASAKFHDIYATLRTGGTSTDYNSFNNFRVAAAITSITIKGDNGTSSFTGGSYILYGVN